MPAFLILVVEENSNDLLDLQLAFSKADLQGLTQFVRNGEEAMDYLLGMSPFDNRAKHPFPNLLLVDLKLPGRSEFQLLSWLRKPPFMDSRLKVAVMSDCARQQDFERASALGVDLCLDKSAGLQELMAAVKRIITESHGAVSEAPHSGESFILVAEDDPNDAQLLKWAFTKAGLGAVVQFVRNGAEAMDYLVGTPPFDNRAKHPFPQLLMLDLKMPCVDGFELLSWLRKLPILDRLKVAVMSGSSWEQDFERAHALGADFCLNKSLDFSELVAALRSLAADRN